MREKKKVRLKALMEMGDGRSFWTGAYECSICGLVSRPDPYDKAKLMNDFAAHERDQHTHSEQKASTS